MNNELILWEALAQDKQLTEKYPIVKGYVQQLKEGHDSGASFKRYWIKRRAFLLKGEVSIKSDNFETMRGCVIDMSTVFAHCSNAIDCLRVYDNSLSIFNADFNDDKYNILTILMDSNPNLSKLMQEALHSEMMEDMAQMLRDNPNQLGVTMTCLEKHKDYFQNFISNLTETLNNMPQDQLTQLFDTLKQVMDGQEVLQCLVEQLSKHMQ